ncbi:hypothetical protein GCM10020221_28550 [Streptomyces thioluteus]|uniref:Uncharacterized protein n=1 Tax=Streptomyces thioluteus TaxID=66431 RepID=A0ABP6JHE0_STRTU
MPPGVSLPTASDRNVPEDGDIVVEAVADGKPAGMLVRTPLLHRGLTPAPCAEIAYLIHGDHHRASATIGQLPLH